MDRIPLNELVAVLKNRLPVENYFSAMLAFFVVLLWILIKISPEEERFIKDVFVHYVMVGFIILIVMMQASLRLRKAEQRHIKYRNLTPSKKLQRIIRENLMGTSHDADKKEQQGLRSTYGDQYTPDKTRFYSARSSLAFPTTRYRPGGRPQSFFDDFRRSDRFTVEKDYFTPKRSKFICGQKLWVKFLLPIN